MHKEQNSIIKEAIKSHIKNWKASTATNAAETITHHVCGNVHTLRCKRSTARRFVFIVVAAASTRLHMSCTLAWDVGMWR